MRSSINTRTAATINGEPLCPLCRTRPCTFDNEPGAGSGYFSTCDRCFGLRASVPTCPNRACWTGGHTAPRCEVVDVPVGGIAVADATYACPVCKVRGVRAWWSRQQGLLTGRSDVASVRETGDSWLVTGRRSSALDTLRADAPHYEAEAYATAYLEATDAYAQELLAQQAETYAKCFGSTGSTVRIERRLPDGSLVVEGSATFTR